MHRREVITLAVQTALAALLQPVAGAAAGTGVDPWASAFAQALAVKPWLLGWRTPPQERYDTAQALIEGRLPPELTGALYRNGPAGHEVGGRRYHHWFDGDGMVQRFAIADGRVSHRGRFVETRKQQREQAAGQPLVPGFGTSVANARLGGGADDMNPANIAMLHHAGNLYALWEAGSPHRIDPDSLATLGRHAWAPELAGLPFTAHPKVDGNGELWAFGYALTRSALLLYRIGADGRLRQLELVPLDWLPPVHDFVLTRRHLVIPLPPLRFDAAAFPQAGNVLDALDWQPGRGMPVLVVDRDDFSRRRWFQLPAAWIFHYGNGWEEANGTIRFDGMAYAEPRLLFGLARQVMRGEAGETGSPQPLTATLRPDGSSEIERLGDGSACEFPRVDQRRVGARHRQLYAALRLDGADVTHPMFNAVGRLDLTHGSWDRYRFPAHELAEEHVFVPRPGGSGETDGWLVGTSLDTAAGITRLNLFDAARISAGPLAVASLPYALPLGLHGTFVAG